MTEEEASEQFFRAVNILEEIIESGHRGTRDEVLAELDDSVGE